MHLNDNSANRLVTNAATLALKTGNVNYILAWIPEESEKKVKNLFEKTLCEQRIGKDIQGVAVDWYFKTINQLYCAGDRALFDRRENARFEECAQIVQRAIETRDGIEVIKLVPKIYQDEVRHRFDNLIEKKNPDTDNVAACRAYVAAFINFIRYLHRLSTGRTGSTNPMEHQS